MMDEGSQVRCVIHDEGSERHIQKLLEGEITFDQFKGLQELSGGDLKDPDGLLERQARLLHILNITYKVVRHERIVLHALDRIGQKGNILHIPKEDATFPYVQAVLQHGRLLTPNEYGSMLTSFEGLEILFQQAVSSEAHDKVRAIIDKANGLLPHKAMVLARMHGYTYDKVLQDFIESAGAVELIDADAFMEYVAMNVPELDARGECRLQLTRELATMDNILSMNEFQRTPENREAMVKDIIESSPKYHFVVQNNLRSKAFYETYPEQFPMEELARPMIKWKCEGECMDCPNWKKSLVKAGPHYGHM